MADYFDLSVPAVRAMLPDDVQERSDIAFLAGEAEAEIINHYRQEPLDERGTVNHYHSAVETGNENLNTFNTDPAVYLRYYQVDADSLTSTEEVRFLAAMRRAIAALVVIRSYQRDASPLVKSESRGRRSIEYRTDADPLAGSIPRRVTKWLEPYDKRPKTFAI